MDQKTVRYLITIFRYKDFSKGGEPLFRGIIEVPDLKSQFSLGTFANLRTKKAKELSKQWDEALKAELDMARKTAYELSGYEPTGRDSVGLRDVNGTAAHLGSAITTLSIRDVSNPDLILRNEQMLVKLREEYHEAARREAYGELRHAIDKAILITPTGKLRAKLTDINIMLLAINKKDLDNETPKKES